ncbi:adenylate/guanylate cyclase domain-containing protein [Enterococcus faecium]|nr:adenylate/guanylate cyclase domain-containing protein [Enterococcus faecium]EMF0228866.1 adenylate/guanylate cyclase domain-containing protein [Enterococcus hirae]MCD4963374.1 adenylate/guanylate cyclase domain-containing protein [Enterococcus casseliflavus]EHV2946561.1 adenylate/guanylate cyclase domain-containing protein [Enterococcus faecium]EMF0434402.1 adenylate/guanylate cyclase domain-containing protein [Enterococcus faecium]
MKGCCINLYNNIKRVFHKNLQKENLDKNLEKSVVHSRYMDFSQSIIVPEDETLTIAKFPPNRFSEKIGTHPDFTDDSLLPKTQYICSIFLDIKGSTRLALKYDLETVQKIKNAVLSTGIEIIRYFGGHIHRLQGDAIFAFTGHSKISKSDAIIQAINAASIIQYMNQNILKEYFENVLGVSSLKIRIGIDFGDDDEVLWSKYGIDDINEVTVTSLHADLSSKLQNKASANSIMIGENVFSYLQLPDDLLSDIYIKGNSEEKDYYIMKYKSFNYKMKNFDWSKYLERIAHFESYEGDFQMKCYYFSESEGWIPYYSEKALEKDTDIVYRIEASQLLLHKINSVEWTVSNSGIEASEEEELDYVVPKDAFSEEDIADFRCPRHTAFNGLHYMICKIKSEGNITKNKYFSLYVNDNDLSRSYLKKSELE